MKTTFLLIATLLTLFIAGCTVRINPDRVVTMQITYLNDTKDTITVVTSDPDDFSIEFTNFTYTLSDNSGMKKYAVNVKSFRIIDIQYLDFNEETDTIPNFK